MGRVRAAKRLASRGLATLDAESFDYLNLARLKVIVAACEFEQREFVKARESLSEAWSVLEGLRANNEQLGTGLGSGIHATYSRWWRLEAMRHQLEGRKDSEIEAWQNCADHAKHAAAGWNRLHRAILVMRALDSLAEAYSRNGRVNECNETREAAEKLRDKWNLPVTSESSVEMPSFFSRLLRFFASR